MKLQRIKMNATLSVPAPEVDLKYYFIFTANFKIHRATLSQPDELVKFRWNIQISKYGIWPHMEMKYDLKWNVRFDIKLLEWLIWKFESRKRNCHVWVRYIHFHSFKSFRLFESSFLAGFLHRRDISSCKREYSPYVRRTSIKIIQIKLACEQMNRNNDKFSDFSFRSK